MKKSYIVLSLGIIVVGSCCCVYKLNRKKDVDIPLRLLRPVPTVVARSFNRAEIRIFPGRVRARRRVKLAFSVSGLITELNALEGQSFKKGEILSRLDPRDFQHALDIAKAKYAKSKQAFKRIKSLWEKSIVSSSEYEKAKVEYDIAQTELHIRIKAMKDTVLVAPFDGIVANRFVENHEHITKKEPILSFQDISVTEVVIQVPERIIMRGGGAENLKKIQVFFDSEKNYIFDASFRESCACSDSITGTFDAVVVLKKRPEINVLPGMTASVRVETSDTRKQLAPSVLLPGDAVFSDSSGKSYVWIINSDGGKVQKRQIKIGSMHNEGLVIVSGVSEGENVAISGINSLREDIEVRPMSQGKDGLDG
jgi:RND family efflux transporter MFP subunit